VATHGVVVELTVLETVVQDADEAIAKLADGLAMALAAAAELVVVGAGSGRVGAGAGRSLVARVGEVSVPCMARRGREVATRCLGGRRRGGVVLARLGAGEPSSVMTGACSNAEISVLEAPMEATAERAIVP